MKTIPFMPCNCSYTTLTHSLTLSIIQPITKPAVHDQLESVVGTLLGGCADDVLELGLKLVAYRCCGGLCVCWTLRMRSWWENRFLFYYPQPPNHQTTTQMMMMTVMFVYFPESRHKLLFCFITNIFSCFNHKIKRNVLTLNREE